MANRNFKGQTKNATTGSYPAGNGGRVRWEQFEGVDGMNAQWEPAENDIYNGTLKRMEMETGRFTPEYPKLRARTVINGR